MGNQGKGKRAWGGDRKSSSSRESGASRAQPRPRKSTNPHMDGRGQSGQPKNR